MSNKHTPRPWFFEENEYTWQLFGGDGIMPLQLLKAPKKDTPYAEYWPKAADAHLIAAAPDLLEALEELVDLMEAVRSGEYRPDSFTTQPACAAIAKAKGEPAPATKEE